MVPRSDATEQTPRRDDLLTAEEQHRLLDLLYDVFQDDDSSIPLEHWNDYESLTAPFHFTRRWSR